MNVMPSPPVRPGWAVGSLALALGLVIAVAAASRAAAQTITTCEAIGCGGRYFLCASYSWGGSAPGSRDCYTNRLPGQGS